MGMVFAKESGVRQFGELPVHFTKDEAWDDSSPFVTAHPNLFADQPSRVRDAAPAPAPSGRVERATNRPGDRR